MRLLVLLLLTFATLMSGTGRAMDPVYAPLALYEGSWEVSRKDLAPGGKPDRLKNECALVGRYYTCQQTVNGEAGALLIFIPANKPGHYYTQNVMRDGRASGRGDLEISGNQWIYSSIWDQGGKTTYYRTTNVFTGKNRIHFEQAESPNGTQWTVKNSGDEVRIGTASR